MSTLATSANPANDDASYDALLTALRAHFATVTASPVPLFTTDADGLFAALLAALPAEARQHYTCHACRRFVDTYGGLVTIDDAGRSTPLLWDASLAVGIFEAPIAALRRLVTRAKVTGVFLSSDRSWGTPRTGEWVHMAVVPPASMVFKSTAIKNAYQASAEKHEDYGTLCRGLAEFPAAAVEQAHSLLTNGQLYRSEKCIGVAKWLLDLHTARAAEKGKARDNVTWRAVATAPTGFCHVRSTMIGTLLEDIAAGLPFATIKARFDGKMSPLQYQRPTAPPSAGNIAQAEKVVAELGAAGALERRFARLADIQTIWVPTETPAPPPSGGVFGHLLAQPASPTPIAGAPAVVMTWEKFSRDVLPTAVQIECRIPAGAASFYTFLTATNPDAPPIIQWDREDRRNPVNWYTYSGGSPASQWGLTAGAWVKATALSEFPHRWFGGRADHQGDGILFVLAGAKDTRKGAGLALFPEALRSEFHAVRATIEAFSMRGELSGREDASASGLGFRKGQPWNVDVRVSPRTGPATVYRIDRWD